MHRPDPLRHGWFKIPGIQPLGDRTIEEQMSGLDPAIREAAGKSVLDIGTAEGPISLAFAKAGAARVFGIESVEGHLIVARYICQEYPNVTFQQAELSMWAQEHPVPEKFDIVLALAVIHKLHYPEVGARFAARSARKLLLFRPPGDTWESGWNGTIKSKHRPNTCNWFEVMKQEGFVLEKRVRGSHDEGVEYWLRA